MEIAFQIGGHSWLGELISTSVAIVGFLVLFFTILLLFVSTVGLTVPAVLTIALVTGKTVTLGLNALDTVLLVLTIALSTLTFLGLRTSPVQGMIHLTLFAIYGVLLFVP